jgi:hypothetical protein
MMNRKKHFLSHCKGQCHMGVELSSGPSLASGAWRTACGWRWHTGGSRKALSRRTGTSTADGSLHEERSILDEQWNGNYYSKDGQIVTDSDARGLAAALNRAVASMRKAGLDNEEDSLILVYWPIGRVGAVSRFGE